MVLRAAVALALCLTLLASCTDGEHGQARPGPEPSTPTELAVPSHRYSLDRSAPALRNAALGVKPDWYELDDVRSYIERLPKGTSWAPVVWCNVQDEDGLPDWSAVDRIAQEALALKVDLQLKIRVGACELTRGGPYFQSGFVTESQMPTDINAYRDFVRAVVNRYSRLGVHNYAVENEPNTRYQWGGTVAELVQLTEVATSVIRDTDPRAVVTDWGLSTGVYGDALAHRLLVSGRTSAALAAYREYNRTAHDPGPHASSPDALRLVLGTGQELRNLQYVRANERLLARGVFDVRQLHFYQSAAILPEVIAYLKATTPDGVPIEAWEVGRHAGGGAVNLRAEMTRSVCLLLGAGIGEVTWLPLTAPSESGEQNLALLGPDGALRPVARAYRRLALLVAGATSVRPLRLPGLHGVVVTHRRRTALVMWSPSIRRVRLPAGSRVRGLAGDATINGRTLTLGSEPVLVRVSRPYDEIRLTL